DSVLSLDLDLESGTNLPKMSAVPVTVTTDLSKYSYAFSALPKTREDRRILLVSVTGTSVFTGLSETYYQLPKYDGQTTLRPGDLGYMLPPTIYGRVYFSVGRPMVMQAKVYDNDRLLIGDPDGFNPTDPNYYTLYDKVEYVATAGRTRINPTSVDFVSLPIQVEQQDATSVIKSAGFAGARTTIFNTIKDTLSSEWSKLVLHSGDTDLRIMAPGKAMVKDMTGVNPTRFYTQYPSATDIEGSVVYSQALHKAAGESPVYTFAYNNYQAQDGILTYSDGRAEDLIIPSSNALTPDLARITIGDLTGVVTPTSGGTVPTVPTVPTTVPTVPTVPTLQVEGYFPLEIINGTKRDDSEVYVFIKAAQESDGRDCVFKRFGDTDNGVQLRAEPITEAMVTDYSILPDYNYRLDTLTKTSDGRRILLVPPTISGRVYFSVGNPMIMQAKVDANGMLRIGDPDGFKPRDPNYYTLYDKVEYTFTAGRTWLTPTAVGGTWLNPTAVDFVSLPIHIKQPGAVSEIKEAGFAGARTAIFESIKGTLTAGAVSPEWSKLVLPFRGTDLRIMAPGKAMAKGVPGANPFNTRYLNAGIPPFNTYDPDAGISASESYTDYLWEYYKTHQLVVDATEIRELCMWFS
ncbi:MAG: beta-1,3-glucanase family protein, partial [Proteobacteria bacterium]|nr:beta-1,3-glucanase family protein [Pseudomonadota bacterium]